MPSMQPMTPLDGATIAIAVTGSSARRALLGPSATTSQNVRELRQYQIVSDPASASTAFVKFLASDAGTAVVPAAPATAGDIPVPPGAILVYTAVATHVATIAGSTATLYITPGDGA